MSKKPVLNVEANKFIQSAQSFEKSRIEEIKKSRKVAWQLAGASAVVAFAAVVAVAALTPLKTVEPFVIRVDNATGATDIVTTIKKQQRSYDEVIDRYWLAQYVRYRESYDWENVQDTFNAAILLSSPTVQKQLVQTLKESPNAPFKVLKDRAQVKTMINAITFIGHTAQVRFTKVFVPLRAEGKGSQFSQQYIATVSYEYRQDAMSEEDRLINPLGFTVTSYRVDKENAQ